jgi:uncharacterized membrane protein (UPF0127 family)
VLLGALLAALGVALAIGVGLQPGRGRAQAEACDKSQGPYAEVQIDGFPRLALELARTPEERQIGLMDRPYLPPDGGMLFVFPSEATEGFWMFHTLIPLSIAWIDRAGNIVDIQDMPRLNDPYNDREAIQNIYRPGAPYWYALEVNLGWFLQNGVGVGQQIAFCLGS